MTDYPAQTKAHSPWRKAKAKRKWSSLIAALTVVLLVLFILSGLIKNVPFGSVLSGQQWNGDVSLAFAVNSNPPIIIVYKNEPPKLTVFKIPDGVMYTTGSAREPIARVGDLFDGSGDKATGVLSRIAGINVAKYVYFKGRPDVAADGLKDLFLDFASVKTPFAIVLGTYNGEVESVDFSKVELLRLWWHLKGLDWNKVDVVDGGNFTEEVLGGGKEKFRELDREAMWRLLAPYFDSGITSKRDIKIVNDSGTNGAGNLAVEMIGAYGYKVTGVSTTDDVSQHCRLVTSSPKEVSKLASIFNCDIVAAQNESGEGKTIMFLGREFSNRYF